MLNHPPEIVCRSVARHYTVPRSRHGRGSQRTRDPVAQEGKRERDLVRGAPADDELIRLRIVVSEPEDDEEGLAELFALCAAYSSLSTRDGPSWSK